jgi:hypothetical protein
MWSDPAPLRICYDRSLLGELVRAVWLATVEVYRQVLGRGDVKPGMVDPCDLKFVPDPEFREAEFREAQAETSRELQLILDPDFF